MGGAPAVAPQGVRGIPLKLYAGEPTGGGTGPHASGRVQTLLPVLGKTLKGLQTPATNVRFTLTTRGGPATRDEPQPEAHRSATRTLVLRPSQNRLTHVGSVINFLDSEACEQPRGAQVLTESNRHSMSLRPTESHTTAVTHKNRHYNLPTVADLFMESLDRHRPQRRRTRDLIRDLPLEVLREDLHKFLEMSLEDLTLRGYAAAWHDMLEFCSLVRLPPCEYAAALYVRRLMLTPDAKGKHLMLSTLLTTSKAISAISGRLDPFLWRQGYLTIVNRILIKMGAKIPTHQAQPLLRSQVYEFVDRPGIPEPHRMLVYLAWKLAARADDLRKCRASDCRHVNHQGRNLIVVRWVPSERRGAGSGRQKNLHALGHACVLDCGEYHNRVMRYLKERQRVRGPLSPYTTEQVTAFLKKYIDKKLSGHSPKRGALQELVALSAPVSLIVRMARHKEEGGLPMATRVYLSPIPVALLEGTQVATAML